MDEDESEERKGAFIVGEVGRGVMSVDGRTWGMASEILGESGSMFCLSFMEHTIFSKPRDVMCFSLPRLVAMVVGGVRVGEGLMWRGAVGDGLGSSDTFESSDAKESTLAESSGTSLRPGLDLAKSIAGVVASSGCVSQQSVSRFHMRQLRFSSLRPFSIESAHFEKTKMGVRKLRRNAMFKTHHSTCQTGSPHSWYRHRAFSQRQLRALGSLIGQACLLPLAASARAD